MADFGAQFRGSVHFLHLQRKIMLSKWAKPRSASGFDVVHRFVVPLVVLSLFLLPKHFMFRDRRHNCDDNAFQKTVSATSTDGATDPTLQGEL
jgi:hypothetical protein